MQIILDGSLLIRRLTSLLLIVPVVVGEIYSNEFAVHISGGENVASNLALKYGFRNYGQIGIQENHYLFIHEKVSKRSTEVSEGWHINLAQEPQVHFLEQQKITRSPRSTKEAKIFGRKTRSTDVRAYSDSFDYYSYDYFSSGCHEQCYEPAGCSGQNPEDCYKCKMYRDRNTEECVVQCPDGQFPPPESHQRCRNCNENCLTCFGHAINNCLSCKSDYFLREDTAKCVTSCDNGFYADENKVCKFCDLTCYTCATASDFCTGCPIGLYLNNRHRCVSVCNDNEYVADDSRCQPCDEACNTCDGPTVEGCVTCKDSYVLQDEKCVHRDNCPPDYYISDDDECLSCHPACAECNGPEDHDCTQCPTHYVLIDHHCLQSCGDQKYVNEKGNCGDCPRSCKTCVTSTSCIECLDDWVLVDEGCQVGCPSGMYEMDNACYSCHRTCSECTGGDPHDCIKCRVEDPERFLYNHKCLLVCPDGYFGDQTYEFNPQCTKCDETCATCNGPSYLDCQKCMDGLVKNKDNNECTEVSFDCPVNCNCIEEFQCTTCKDGYYMYNRECIAVCPPRFAALSSPKICGACHPSCESCSGISHHNCTTCISSYYLTPDNTCEPDCFWFKKTYPNRDDWQCSPCHTMCAMCYGPQADDCIVCVDGHFLLALEDVAGSVKHTCVEGDGCGDDSYADETNNECVPCYPTCNGCTGPDATNCVECRSSFSKDLDGVCQSVCSVGQFQDGASDCVDCHSTCLTCTGTESTNCLTCDFTRYLRPSSGNCLEHCDDMYYPDFEDNVCKPCFPTCQTCASYEESECLTCKEGYYIHMGRYCRLQCPEGYYEYDLGGELTCRQCSVECADCMGNYLNCTKCDNEFLHLGRCLAQCPVGYEGTSGHCVVNKAQQENGYLCPPFCIACMDGYCTICKTGYTIYFGGCLDITSDCDNNQYYDGDSCMDCDATCRTCLGPTSLDCLLCPEGKFLEGGRCLKDCPSELYMDIDTDECGECHPTCKTCSGPSQYDCDSCQNDMYLSDKSCHNECPPGFYYNEASDCEVCHQSCKICSQVPTNCLACPRDTFLLGSKCVEFCPIELGHYHFIPDETEFVSSTNECRDCSISCRTCFGGEENECTTCKENLFLKDNECLFNCGTFFYEHATTKTCKHCSKSCESCGGETDKDCLTCQGEKYLVEGECLDIPPEHYYCINTAYGKECRRCHASCLTCSGGGGVFDCDQCHEGHIFDNGICYPRCATGKYFQVNNRTAEADDECGKCVPPCYDCYGPKPHQCITCIDGKKMHHIDKSHHYCVTCCEEGEPPVEGECCECNKKNDHCRPGVKNNTSEGTHQNNNRTSGSSSHVTAIILSCLGVIVLFFAIFGLLQARSNRTLCFTAYERLPTYYNGSNVQVVLGKEPQMSNKHEYMSPDEEDTDEYPSDDDDDNEEIY